MTVFWKAIRQDWLLNSGFLVVLFAFCIALFLKSDGPCPGAHKIGGEGQKSAREIQDGSDPNYDSASPLKSFGQSQTGAYNEYQGTKDEKEKASKKWWRDPNWFIVILTAGLLASAVIQVCVYVAQTKLMRHALRENRRATVITGRSADAAEKSARMSRLTFELGESAELQITEMKFTAYYPAENVSVAFELKNFGHTMASDVEVLVVFSEVEKATHAVCRIQMPRCALAGGEGRKFPIMLCDISPPFTDETVRGFLSGKTRFSFEVRANYLDVFEKRQFVEFYATYYQPRDTFIYNCVTRRKYDLT